MSVNQGVNYGVLRGKVINAIPYNGGADHFQIEIQAGQIYRIAVDVYSMIAGNRRKYARDRHPTLDNDRRVMYFKDEDYKHPVTAAILQVETGFTPKEKMDKSIHLDYLRYQPALFNLEAMRVVAPKTDDGQQDDLNDDIGPWVNKAINNDDAEVFAFGSGWDDNADGGHPDAKVYFNPNPALGIHDIHMNQGDTGNEAKYNGIWQDGALFFYFKAEERWVAMFFKFQNQSTSTDDNGDPK